MNIASRALTCSSPGAMALSSTWPHATASRSPARTSNALPCAIRKDRRRSLPNRPRPSARFSATELAARRICAAHQLAQIAFAEPSTETRGDSRGVLWYARLLLQALEAGGPDPIVLSLRGAVESAERAAA